MEPEIIHFWQFLGQVHPKLLEDEVIKNAKSAGVTSLQSYFLWSEVEKEKGKFDWSSYDVLVEKIKKHNLKWVPFFIAGPAYSTPQWFKKSSEAVFYQCLEHQKECANQSIWNPNLPGYIEKFLAETSAHFSDKNIFESIILGISGNWGEAIYPAGGYWFGRFHSHNGFWAGDRYAKENFINFALGKYQTLANLNSAWGTNFSNNGEIDFPPLKESKRKLLTNGIINLISKSPVFFKKPLKFILSRLTKKAFFSISESPVIIKNSSKQQRWIDFVKWYLDSITNWSEFWLKTARKYFPETKIYLVTGGNSSPILGADFVGQVKAAAKYGAGIRVTNLTNDYAQSFILTRLISSATRFYKTYLTTEEEAVLQTPEGVTMRIFDVISSGACGFFCRNIVSLGKICPFVAVEKLSVGQLTPGADNLKKYFPLINFQNPEIKAAVFYPNTAIAKDFSLVTSFYNRCARMRDILDFDLVDETMIKDGVLEKYQYLFVLSGELPKVDLPKDLKIVFDPKEVVSDIDNEYDGVYATKFADKVLYYNSNNKKIKKNIPFLNKTIELNANTITCFIR